VPEQPDRTWFCVHVTLALKAVESCSKAPKLTSKKYAKAINLLWEGKKCLLNIMQAEGVF